MRRLVIDSSVFVAAFRGGELHSDQATTLVEAIRLEELAGCVPLSVVVEVLAAIKRRTDDVHLVKRVKDSLYSWHSLEIVDEFRGLALEHLLEVAGMSGVRGMDVFPIALAGSRNLPLVTLDREMVEKAGLFVDIVTIEEVLNG